MEKHKIGDKVTLKSEVREDSDKQIYEHIAEGWKVIKEQKQNFWGVWICRMKKVKVAY